MSVKQLVLLGGGGHAKVVYDVVTEMRLYIKAVVEPATPCDPFFARLEQWHADADVLQLPSDSIMLVNGIGSIRVSESRRRIFEFFKGRSYRFFTLKHPSAIVSKFAEVGEGAQIMAASVVQVGSYIGANSIINTKASVDHDCFVGDHVHIAPGVTLSGGVYIGSGSHIGTGATVIQGVRIGNNVTVAAGAVVTRDIADGLLVKGIPAR